MDEIFIITDPDAGWDCIIDVCIDEDYVNETYGKNPNKYCIQKKIINTCKIKK